MKILLFGATGSAGGSVLKVCLAAPADLGRAMLQATAENLRGRIIENAEIRDVAERARA